MPDVRIPVQLIALQNSVINRTPVRLVTVNRTPIRLRYENNRSPVRLGVLEMSLTQINRIPVRLPSVNRTPVRLGTLEILLTAE